MRPLAFSVAVVALSALAGPGIAQSRYSAAEASHPPASPQSTAKAAGLRYLTWPGKVAPPAPIAAVTLPTSPAIPARAAVAPASTASLPTSIYAPAPPMPPPQPAAAVQALAQASPPGGAGHPSARYYSLHRAYGEAPDPIPLAPQFFADGSPDLAEPPPQPPRTMTTTGGRVVRVAPNAPQTATD